MDVATLFDKDFSVEGYVCAKSAVERGRAGTVFILCLDSYVEKTLFNQISGAVLIPLGDVESFYPILPKLKAQRDWKSYVGTLKPFLLGYLLEFFAVDRVAMVDSDMFFWGSTKELERVMGDAGVLVVSREHDPPLRSGWFNDGFVAAGLSGISFVRWWQERCVEWCEWMQQGPNGAFQAEGYLNIIHDDPSLFPEAKWVEHPGINLAQWNVRWHKLVPDGDRFLVDNEYPLVCFHYRDFQDHTQPFWEDAPVLKENLNLIYRPYYQFLRDAAGSAVFSMR